MLNKSLIEQIQIMEAGFTHSPSFAASLPVALIPDRSQVTSLSLQCELMFGSPSSNCGGNGICKIIAKQPDNRPAFRTHCSRAKALFVTGQDSQTVSLVFRREWLCSNLMRHYFRHGIFEMPEPCPIPSQLVAASGTALSELPAGLHPIEDCGAYLLIHFKKNESLS
jgi:hypothetical protein